VRKKCRISASPVLVLALCLCIYTGFAHAITHVVLSAIAHEMGHLLYLFLRRREVRSVRFRLLGACMETVPLSYVDDMLCAQSGPVVNLFLYLLQCGHGIFALINLGLFLFNMLPIYPLDGGRILRAALLCFFQEKIVSSAVRVIGIIMSLLLMLGVVSLCVLLQRGIWLMVICGIVILKLNFDAEREGY